MVARVRKPLTGNLLSQIKVHLRGKSTSLSLKHSIGTFRDSYILKIASKVFSQHAVFVKIVPVILGKLIGNVEIIAFVVNIRDDVKILFKISGKRKRKRLISVDLKSVDDFGPYLNETELNPDVTVLAEDGTGIDLWYVFIETESTGKVAIIFNPDERTRKNIIGGLEPVLRAKLSAKYLSGAEETEE